MNWKRGLIRLWLLASIVITGSIAWGAGEDIEYECGRSERNCLIQLLDVAVLSVAGSVALLIVGVIAVWVVRGFRREEAQA
jgi:hypothetical protein